MRVIVFYVWLDFGCAQESELLPAGVLCWGEVVIIDEYVFMWCRLGSRSR